MGRVFDKQRLISFLVIIVVVYLIGAAMQATLKNYDLRRQTDSLKDNIEQLKTDVETLQYQIAYFRTENYQELAARDKLGLQKPGESVLIVPGDLRTKSTTSAPVKAAAAPQRKPVEAWQEFLFGAEGL